MDPQPSPHPVTLAELLLKTGILAVKILVPMLWLQSKLSPLQFLIGGAALVLVVFFFDLPPQGSRSPRQIHPRGTGAASSREMDTPD
jgi:hypothetical protein